jgi:streptogramin lyase
MRVRRWVKRTTILAAVAVMVSGCDGSDDGSRSGTPSEPVPTETPAAPEPLFTDPVGVAFDRAGDVWVADYRASTLQRFDSSDLAKTGEVHVQPTVRIADVGGPNQLRYGPDGRLWVVSYDANQIRAYDPASLASGSPRPAIVIRGPRIGSPTDLAFDTVGHLWIANQDSGELVAYTAEQLRTSGAPAPATIVHIAGFGSGTAEAIAFDREGRLWVSGYDDDAVVAVAPGDLHDGSPPIQERLSLATGSGPIGLTVDERDRLWIAEATADTVAAYALSPGGPPRRPSTTLRSPALIMPHSVTFDAAGNAWVPYYDGIVGRYGRPSPGSDGVSAADLQLS